MLIVEDDAQFRALLIESLEGDGYDVAAADCADAALDLYDDWSPDVVVTDLVMPGTNGISLIMDLRCVDAHVPVIAISGGRRISARSYLQTAAALGATSVLAKPSDLDTLLTTLRQVRGVH